MIIFKNIIILIVGLFITIMFLNSDKIDEKLTIKNIYSNTKNEKEK